MSDPLVFDAAVGMLKAVGDCFQPVALITNRDIANGASGRVNYAVLCSRVGLLACVVRGKKMRSVAGLFDEFGAAFQFPYGFEEGWRGLRESLAALDQFDRQEGIVVLVEDADQVLADDPSEMENLLGVLESVSGHYGALPAPGEEDRVGVPFHVMLQSRAVDGLRLWAGGGVEFRVVTYFRRDKGYPNCFERLIGGRVRAFKKALRPFFMEARREGPSLFETIEDVFLPKVSLAGPGDAVCLGRRLARDGFLARVARGGKMRTVDGVFDEFGAAFQFPYYFGENYGAFDECLADMDWLDYGKGIVVVIPDAGQVCADDDPVEMRVILEIFAAAAGTYREPVILGEFWDRPAIPFHVVLQAESVEALGLWTAYCADLQMIDIPAGGGDVS
jgi:hypothetical protein